MPTPLRRWLPAATLLAALTFWPACGDDATTDAPSDLLCIPGETQLCVCPGAEAGAQSCEDSGLRFSACVCPGGDANNNDHNDDHNDDHNNNNAEASYDPTLTGDPTSGELLFIQHCSVCHGVEGQGTTLGPDLSDEVAEEDDDELWEIILEGEDSMPAIDLTPKETADVVSWLRQEFGAAEGEDDEDDEDDHHEDDEDDGD